MFEETHSSKDRSMIAASIKLVYALEYGNGVSL